MQYCNRKLNLLQKDPPYGNMKYSESYLSELMATVYADWTIEDDDFVLPKPLDNTYVWSSTSKSYVVDKDLALAALDAIYDPQFDYLTLAWATASMDGDTTTATARLADKQALKEEYQQKREAIING